MSSKRTVFVIGATGAQGGSVVDALLINGQNVIAAARDPNSASAQALSNRGVTVRKADYSDQNSMRDAAKGADAAFIVTTPFEAGTDAEAAQGITMVDAMRDAGVGHVVFSSVGNADMATGIPHFDSKHKVEQYLAASGVPYSIVAPVYFMENMTAPYALPELAKGNIAAAMPVDRPLQQVAVKNIGDFAAALIERRETVFGKRYNIAGDELALADAAKKASLSMGREIAAQSYPVAGLKAQSEDMGLMFEWFDATGYTADISKLKSEFPEVNWLSFSDWLSLQDWSGLGAS